MLCKSTLSSNEFHSNILRSSWHFEDVVRNSIGRRKNCADVMGMGTKNFFKKLMTQFDRASKMSWRPFDYFFDILSNRIYINFQSWPKLAPYKALGMAYFHWSAPCDVTIPLLSSAAIVFLWQNTVKRLETTFLVCFVISSWLMGPKILNEQCAAKTKCVDRNNSLKSGFCEGCSTNLARSSIYFFQFNIVSS